MGFRLINLSQHRNKDMNLRTMRVMRQMAAIKVCFHGIQLGIALIHASQIAAMLDWITWMIPLTSLMLTRSKLSLKTTTLVIDRFPHGHPGAPVSGIGQASIFEATCNGLGDSIWAPFRSQCDWEIARWAKMRGPTSTAVTELLAIPEV